MAAKRIGFVDDDLDNFHANTYLKALRGPLAERGWRVAGATALQAEKGRGWADRNQVERLVVGGAQQHPTFAIEFGDVSLGRSLIPEAYTRGGMSGLTASVPAEGLEGYAVELSAKGPQR